MALQTTWFVLVLLIVTGYAVLDGFDLGIGALLPVLARTKEDRSALRRVMGPFWDGNEVWLIVAAGALFAAFPPVYGAVLSGFYIPLMLVLFSLVLRAVSFGFHEPSDRWAWLWTWGLALGSLVPAVLFGLVLGNIVRGVEIDSAGFIVGFPGTLLNPYAVLVSALGIAAFAHQGASWATLKLGEPARSRASAVRVWTHALFAAAVLLAATATAALLPERFRTVLSRPLGWVAVAALAAGLIGARVAMAQDRDRAAFALSSVSIASLTAIAGVSLYPTLLPALGAGKALTIADASSSPLALLAMLVVAVIGMPIVLAYTVFVYRTFGERVHPGGSTY